MALPSFSHSVARTLRAVDQASAGASIKI